jgi:hypothetical protein
MSTNYVEMAKRRGLVRKRSTQIAAVVFFALGVAPFESSNVASAVDAAGPSSVDFAFLGVRILKSDGVGMLDWTPELPAGCAICRLEVNGFTSGQTPREIFFHFWAPRSSDVVKDLRVRVDPTKIRGVLVSQTDVDLPKREFSRVEDFAEGPIALKFARTDAGITFDVPLHSHGVKLPPDDLGDVTEHYTFIETPGLYIRVAHADPRERRGAYASGRWPAVEAQAALNLEFAAREAITELGLAQTLQQRGVTRITIMNFDTNYPTLGPQEAHADWPPHWHMHLYWSAKPKVRQVGHFYISPDGLLIQDSTSILEPESHGSDWISTWHARGEPEGTSTQEGEELYTQVITPEGFFELGTSGGTCRFTPSAHGFNSGVNLACSGQASIKEIRAVDDVVLGRLRLFEKGRLVQTYRYDVDTGALIEGEPPPSATQPLY